MRSLDNPGVSGPSMSRKSEVPCKSCKPSELPKYTRLGPQFSPWFSRSFFPVRLDGACSGEFTRAPLGVISGGFGFDRKGVPLPAVLGARARHEPLRSARARGRGRAHNLGGLVFTQNVYGDLQRVALLRGLRGVGVRRPRARGEGETTREAQISGLGFRRRGESEAAADHGGVGERSASSGFRGDRSRRALRV